MLYHLREFQVKTSKRLCFTDITAEVSAIVRESGIGQGKVVVFVPHTTAAVTINENADPDVVHDLETIFQRLVPYQKGYRHGEGNSDAHMMTTLTGASETLLIHRGKLLLGTWQSLYLAEFDGPRHRRVVVQVEGLQS
ncbi:secondary thiamine-phosphate synthase enzyme YjbQ [Heliorestis convoluta]|uniref:Secondary thiamine-phosphate synthase enzyme n=1 Tax=Heliorestis convoluta TaxID=356322 RepID=A0A5Q2N1V6_9FIRM|nr:secondary thiamine-phosphate synthase enzyme YjbQ [Heliorestis convoluta]QGG48281.1 secondary thiamine-phosphate synthase enzyme [Heliorestis convoluta]